MLCDAFAGFTFHYVSINSIIKPIETQTKANLHSTMYLLIQAIP